MREERGGRICIAALRALPSCLSVAFQVSRRNEFSERFSPVERFRFPREIVAYAVWAYHRFALSTADVEDLLAERGVIVSRETVRLWINRFAAILPPAFAGTDQS